MEAYVLRRAEFLINEAVHKDANRDQTVTFAMRVISNNVTIGKDGGSATIKWLNARISEAAYAGLIELLRAEDHREAMQEWCRRTENEHPEPLESVWKWIRDNVKDLSPEMIIDRFRQHPMITVLKHEDRKLRRSGGRSLGLPESRYAVAEIVLAKHAIAPKQLIELITGREIADDVVAALV